MTLTMFREHLAQELRCFPEEPGPSFHSYAVTTAALARIILEYLGMDDLTVPAPFGERAHRLKTVLDQIIHFREVWPEGLLPSGRPASIMVYSDRTKLYGDRLHVAWAPYRDVILRLANDDVFVARYLLRRAVTVLMQATRTENAARRYATGHQKGEYRRRMSRITMDAWDIVVALSEAGNAKTPGVVFDCYEELFDEAKSTRHVRCWTCEEFIGGYRKSWTWTGLNPDKVNILGAKTWCHFICDSKRIEGRKIKGFAIPLDAFVGIFQDILAQLP